MPALCPVKASGVSACGLDGTLPEVRPEDEMAHEDLSIAFGRGFIPPTLPSGAEADGDPAVAVIPVARG
jgi:hypothetical protein